MVGIPDEPELTSLEWKEFIEHPAMDELNKLIFSRIEICRAQLEAGIKYETVAEGTIAVELEFKDITRIQGECSTLRWLQKVFTLYGLEIMKEEQAKEKEKQNEGDKENG